MSKVEFFKPSDFATAVTVGNTTCTITDGDKRNMAAIANRILAERGTRVYGRYAPPSDMWTEAGCAADTHVALLVCVEPIRKDTAESLLREIIYRGDVLMPKGWEDRARKVLGER